MARRDITGAFDFAYLEGFAGGDEAMIDEVLALFRQQAESWSRMLDPAEPNWRDAVHTLKGTSRGIGAFRLGDACERAELSGEVLAVRDELDQALLDIAAYSHERLLKGLKGRPPV